MMIADIATGETDVADVAFLVALIVAVVAAVIMWRPGPTADRYGGPLVAVAVAAAAFGLLLL